MSTNELLPINLKNINDLERYIDLFHDLLKNTSTFKKLKKLI